MNYIKKHLKWIIIFIVLLIVFVFVLIFGTKEENVKEKESNNKTEVESTTENETTGKNGISVESEDPYDDEEWGPITYK